MFVVVSIVFAVVNFVRIKQGKAREKLRKPRYAKRKAPSNCKVQKKEFSLVKHFNLRGQE